MPAKTGNRAYSEEEKAEIIAHVLVNVASGRFVSRVFREDAEVNGVIMPDVRQFWRWVLEDDNLADGAPEKLELSHKLARARESGIEALLDETVEIADISTHDTLVREGEDGESYERANTEWIQRSKLRIETRIKLAQMLKPKKYREGIDVTSGGEKIGQMATIDAMRKRVIEGMKRVNQQDDE